MALIKGPPTSVLKVVIPLGSRGMTTATSLHQATDTARDACKVFSSTREKDYSTRPL